MFAGLRCWCPAAVHIFTHSVNLTCWPKSGFNINARFGLVISSSGYILLHLTNTYVCENFGRTTLNSQLWIANHLHFDKGIRFCFMVDFDIDYVFWYFTKHNARLKQTTKDERLNQWKPNISCKPAQNFVKYSPLKCLSFLCPQHCSALSGRSCTFIICRPTNFIALPICERK